ncbi:MAG TPA: cyclase family protein [Acidimicrobiales bacterium]|nr:cyclase family protein [Acidimicrobiales bacterium]
MVSSSDGALPSYDDLPIKEGAPAGSSWGVWGDDDRFGCLNLLTPARAAAAAKLVGKGAVFALNLEYELPDPPLFGRQAPQHDVLGEGGHDDVLTFNTQSSSQWDGFRHVQHPLHKHYNGIDDAHHGIDHWATRGLAGRAVLVDVARHRDIDASTAEPITPEDLDATLAAQGTTTEIGDILLLRTGWTTWYRNLDEDARQSLPQQLKAPGLRPGTDMLRWLWDHHLAAVGSDNPALEIWPPGSHLTKEQRDDIRAADDPERTPEIFMHTALLPLLGLPIGELWDLDALAADCAADGVYVGLFTSAPLRVRAGVASPPNALVLK